MKIQDFMKAREEASFINLETGELKSKAQLMGQVKTGVLCMIAAEEKEDSMRDRVKEVLSNYELHNQELEVKATEFIENMAGPTKEELEKIAKEEEIKKIEAEKLAKAKLKKAEQEAKARAKEEKKKPQADPENENLDSTMKSEKPETNTAAETSPGTETTTEPEPNP